MFICEKCLESNYNNFAIPFSYGKCDDCGKVKACADIKSSRLIHREFTDAEKGEDFVD